MYCSPEYKQISYVLESPYGIVLYLTTKELVML
jgi:hypothetical protein